MATRTQEQAEQDYEAYHNNYYPVKSSQSPTGVAWAQRVPINIHRNYDPGTPGTSIILCPDCGQMEIWTELESDHGLCRSRSVTCDDCGFAAE